MMGLVDMATIENSHPSVFNVERDVKRSRDDLDVVCDGDILQYGLATIFIKNGEPISFSAQWNSPLYGTAASENIMSDDFVGVRWPRYVTLSDCNTTLRAVKRPLGNNTSADNKPGKQTAMVSYTLLL